MISKNLTEVKEGDVFCSVGGSVFYEIDGQNAREIYEENENFYAIALADAARDTSFPAIIVLVQDGNAWSGWRTEELRCTISGGGLADMKVKKLSPKNAADILFFSSHLSKYGSLDNVVVPEVEKPDISLSKVILSEEKKTQIEEAISQRENNDLIFTEWGFGKVFEKGTAVTLLFWGVPGTGKTLTAEVIASQLGLKLRIIQAGEIQSSEPGGAERTLKEIFSNAEKKKELLLFDECDSLIWDRNDVGMILGAQINTLLSCLERFTGVCIFTTNRLGVLDPAFERRVSAKIEFPFPDEQARESIWKGLIPSEAPLDKDVDIKQLAQFPIAGGNIKNCVLNAARKAAYEKSKTIKMSHFKTAIELEMRSMKNFEAAFNKQTPIARYPGGAKRGANIAVDAGGSLKIDRTRERKMSIRDRLKAIGGL